MKKGDKMNAYDFDDTIYDGESMYDFFFLCLKKDLTLFRYIPEVTYRLLQYKRNHLKLDQLIHTAEKIVELFLKRNHIAIDELAEQFWKRNYHKLKPQFLKQLKKEDVIITGAPRFVIEPIQKELKVKNIICTEVDLEKFQITFLCLKENKVKAFLKKYPNQMIENFYTDSLSDVPMMKYAKNVYFVNGNEVHKVDKEKYCK